MKKRYKLTVRIDGENIKFESTEGFRFKFFGRLQARLIIRRGYRAVLKDGSVLTWVPPSRIMWVELERVEPW